MRLDLGDFVLVQTPIYGYSESNCDLGPFICEVIGFDGGINLRHYQSPRSWSQLTVSFETPVIRLHNVDVRILIMASLGKG